MKIIPSIIPWCVAEGNFEFVVGYAIKRENVSKTSDGGVKFVGNYSILWQDFSLSSVGRA